MIGCSLGPIKGYCSGLRQRLDVKAVLDSMSWQALLCPALHFCSFALRRRLCSPKECVSGCKGFACSHSMTWAVTWSSSTVKEAYRLPGSAYTSCNDYKQPVCLSGAGGPIPAQRTSDCKCKCITSCKGFTFSHSVTWAMSFSTSSLSSAFARDISGRPGLSSASILVRCLSLSEARSRGTPS